MNRFIGTLFTFVLFAANQLSVLSAEPKLTGQPVWFSLGGEVYHARERIDAEKSLLEFDPQPRWFTGFPRPATKEEFTAWLKKQMGQSQLEEPTEASYQIPTAPPYPKQLADVPTQALGSSLSLAAEKGATADEISFVLTLTAGERAVRREIEHRFTNVVPFLFALYADGQAVTRELEGVRKEGGAHQFLEIVPAKEKKVWQLRVDQNSLAAIVPRGTKVVTVVAAFSERQHQGYGPDGALSLEHFDLKQIPPQILIRSNVVQLTAKGNGWQPGTAE